MKDVPRPQVQYVDFWAQGNVRPGGCDRSPSLHRVAPVVGGRFSFTTRAIFNTSDSKRARNFTLGSRAPVGRSFWGLVGLLCGDCPAVCASEHVESWTAKEPLYFWGHPLRSATLEFFEFVAEN